MSPTLTGYLLAGGALLLFTVGTLVTRAAASRVSLGIGFLVATGTNVAFSALALAVQHALAPQPIALDGQAFMLFALAGAFSTYLGRWFFYESVVRFGAARASIFQVSSPLFTALMAWALLGEKLSLSACIGMALTVGGLMLVGLKPGTFFRAGGAAQVPAALDIPYVLLNPGASFRGLHDSIGNHLGNEKPQMIVVLHEEHAVAIAHGYAKVAGKPLAAILHSNVGLMHGSMAIFDAWVDRVPVIVLGATGPVDAAKRRPWIDWIHTAQDQAALVRHFIKWDCQPASIGASQEALLRAKQIATTAPQGPVYVCFDAALQESRLSEAPVMPDPSRYLAPPPARPSDEPVRRAAELLSKARRPVILAGRVNRDTAAWQQRVQLAEMLNAEVLTDLKIGCAFPTAHPLHAAPSGHFLNATSREVLRGADVVLSLDWLDLAGTLKQAWDNEPVGSQVIQVSVDHYSHNGWSMDHQGLPPVDVFLASEPEPAVELLLQHVTKREAPAPQRAPLPAPAVIAPGPMTVPILAGTLRRAVGAQKVCLMRLPLSWSGDLWDFEHPLDFLGYDGGGGIGSGPGMAIGSALALKGTDRLPVAVIGDGDYMMGVNALWTAANAQIPMLMVVCNNRSFFNDELHQERVARQRSRPVENRWIGQRIANPEPDLAMMARAQGLTGFGPVEDAAELERVLVEAIALVKGGATVVIDAVVQTGYSPSMTAGLTRAD